MRTMTLLLTLLAFLFLLSCYSTEPDVTDEFALQIKLTNTAGTQLEGYGLAIFQKDFNTWFPRFGGRPSTTIGFTTQNDYRVEIVITDYFNNLIRTLIDQQYSAGTYQVTWNGQNDSGDMIRDGVYKIKAKYYDLEGNQIFSDLFLAYKLGDFDVYLAPYITDSSGEVSSTDIVPFPVLYCDEDIQIYDENGYLIKLANFSATSDTMVVVVTAPDETSKSHYFRIKNGNNILNLNWDTMLPYSDKGLRHHGKTIHPTLPEFPNQPKAPAFELINKLHFCYPNPFN